MFNTNTPTQIPDWWEREKRRRQTRMLIFLVLMLLLIGYFYWVSSWGRIGTVHGVNFDTTNYIAFVRLQEKERPDSKGKETITTLCAVRADGSDLRPLTAPEDTSNKFDPAWTIDGKTLLYASNKNDSRVTQIYALGEGGPQQLTYGTGNKFAPIASPDGTHVAFVTQGAVKTVLLNGNDVYQVMPPPRSGNAPTDDSEVAAARIESEPHGAFRYARFSQDGKSIAGVQDLSGDQNPVDLGAMSPGDQVARAIAPGGSRALMLDTGHEVNIAWEPNGARLACSFTELQATDPNKKPVLLSGIRLWSFDSPEKPTPRPLLTCFGNSLAPKNIDWSPDGTKMAFEGWRLKGEGERELGGIIVLSMSQPGIRITPEDVNIVRYMIPVTAAGRPHDPHWSPDGSRLLYEVTRPDGGNDLCIINADGTNPINLTKGVGNNTEAVWSPAHAK
jgi:Tol biopolymer transport system component